MLPLNISDTAATSQDGSSLEFIAAITAIFRMQVVEGCDPEDLEDELVLGLIEDVYTQICMFSAGTTGSRDHFCNDGELTFEKHFYFFIIAFIVVHNAHSIQVSPTHAKHIGL